MINSLVTKAYTAHQIFQIPQPLSAPKAGKPAQSPKKNAFKLWHILILPFALFRCRPEQVVMKKSPVWDGSVRRVNKNLAWFRTKCVDYDKRQASGSELVVDEPIVHIVRRGQLEVITNICSIDPKKIREKKFNGKNLEIRNNGSVYKFKLPVVVKRFRQLCPSRCQNRTHLLFDTRELVCTNTDHNSSHINNK